jgi:hypothetical protein
MRRQSLLGVILVAACGGGGTAEDVVADAPTVDAGPSVDAAPGVCTGLTPALHASFTFEVYGDGVSSFAAQIEDLPYPDTGLVEVEDGACRYVRPGAPFCDPACTDGWCGLDEACHPYPTGLAAGTLTTTGTHPPLTLAPGMFPGSYYPADGVPTGWLVPGETVGAMVPGDDAPAISGEVVAVAAIELPTSQLTATEHEPLTVAWTPAPAGQGGEVVVHFDNDHHGTNSYLECVVPDAAGEVTIPVSVLDPLIADGATGIGTYIENAYVLRRQRTVVPTPLGCAAVQSVSSTWVQVDTVLAE